MAAQHASQAEPGRVFEYPDAQASNDDVVADRLLFYRTLFDFHAGFGATITGPIVDGKEVDLHQLYREVTRRGGLEETLLRNGWDEVIRSFSFSPAATDASAVLLGYYARHLRLYEDVYLRGARGPVNLPPRPATSAAQPAASLGGTEENQGALSQTEQQQQQQQAAEAQQMAALQQSWQVLQQSQQQMADREQQQQQQQDGAAPMDVHEAGGAAPIQGTRAWESLHPPQATGAAKRDPEELRHVVPPAGHSPGVAPEALASKIGLMVRGVIQRPFEFGYIVTVDLGDGERLHGVLYSGSGPAMNGHGKGSHGPSAVYPPGLAAAWNSVEPDSQPEAKRKKRRRRAQADLLPGESPLPRAPCSAYNFFFREWRKKVKEEQPLLNDRQGTALVGERWNALPAEEKQKYKDMAVEDKARYEREYSELLLWRAEAGNGVPSDMQDDTGGEDPLSPDGASAPTTQESLLSAIEPPHPGNVDRSLPAGAVPSAPLTSSLLAHFGHESGGLNPPGELLAVGSGSLLSSTHLSETPAVPASVADSLTGVAASDVGGPPVPNSESAALPGSSVALTAATVPNSGSGSLEGATSALPAGDALGMAAPGGDLPSAVSVQASHDAAQQQAHVKQQEIDGQLAPHAAAGKTSKTTASELDGTSPLL